GNIPYEYENDSEILYEAIKQNPYCFREASDYFRNNEEFTIEAIRNYGVPLDEISDLMWESPSFVLEMVKDFGTSVLHNACFSKEFDLVFVKKLIETDVASYNYLPDKFKKNKEIILIKQKEMEKLAKSAGTKTKEEEMLDNRWDTFLTQLMKENTMQVIDFQKLFYDTFWYFRNRKDVAALGKGGWHILSCLSSFGRMPYEFIPSGCEQNEYNAARCLCEDLVYEINRNMPGFYGPDAFVIEHYCVPPAGCSDISGRMSSFELFQSSFWGVVSDFEDGFSSFRSEKYSERYNF
ncbi:MAG: DUF4116 domain-containing protein, partial [Clostridia bacterium]|nr:DUF4116 domain-containing protein [Clostridia bacterium]